MPPPWVPLSASVGEGNNPNCQQFSLGPEVKQTKWDYSRSHMYVWQGCDGGYSKGGNYATISLCLACLLGLTVV